MSTVRKSCADCIFIVPTSIVIYPYIGGYEKKGNRQNTFSCGKRVGETKRS